MPWYHGPARCSNIWRSIDVESESADKPFRFPVQWVNRPNLDFRGYAGTVVSGTIDGGRCRSWWPHRARALASKELLTYEGAQASAQSGDAITMTLTDEVDIARGDMLVEPGVAPGGLGPVRRPCDLDERPGADARPFLSDADRHQDRAAITVTGIKHKIDVNTREHLATHYARAQRHRVLQSGDRRAGGFRSLRAEPQDRLLHHHRPVHQPDGRRRHDRFRPAPRHQHPLAAAADRQGRSARC